MFRKILELFSLIKLLHFRKLYNERFYGENILRGQ